MCTITWLMEADSYTIFFNRDELKTRSRALPPAIKKQNDVRHIAPVDLDGGGTWIGVNEFGVVCGLLNSYNYACPIPQRPAPEGTTTNYKSRGLLLISLLDSLSQTVALQKLNASNLIDFRPFFLALFAPNRPAVLCIWDGVSLRIQHDKVALPISSSSFDTENVIRQRQQEFVQLQANNQRLGEALLTTYHSSHSARGGAYSVCMHRADAATTSFSRIRVTPEQVEFHYQPGAPCSNEKSMIIKMSRAIAADKIKCHSGSILF